jgi:hypothetical protein
MTHINPDTFPIPPSPTPRVPKRFRSFSILRSRSTSKSVAPPSPTKSHNTKTSAAASISKRKKAAYAHASKASAKYSASASAPVPLANEIALMQLMDGGSTDKNIKRLMAAQAKAAAGTRANQDGALAVGDVYRDEKGGVWWDREEELEYVHLLGGEDEQMQWVTFGGEDKKEEGHDPSLALASLAGLGRRDSSTSTKTVDSDLDPANVVKPADEDGTMMHMTVPGLIHHPVSIPAPAPGPILSIPARPTYPHLRKNPQFLLDLAAFSSPSPARTPRTPRTPLTPLTPIGCNYKRTSPVRGTFSVGAGGTLTPRLRGKARRRPAPLKLVGHAHATQDRGTTGMVSAGIGADGDASRQDFMDASFAPAPLPLGLAPPPAVQMALSASCKPAVLTMKKKTSRMGLAFFVRRERA